MYLAYFSLLSFRYCGKYPVSMLNTVSGWLCAPNRSSSFSILFSTRECTCGLSYSPCANALNLLCICSAVIMYEKCHPPGLTIW